MSEQERLTMVENKIDRHLSDENSKNIDIFSKLATFENTLISFPDIIANKIMDKIDEKYVSKEYANNLISREREKSDKRYVLKENFKSDWNDCQDEHSTKTLDKTSKKTKIFGFYYGLIGSIIGILISLIVQGFSFVTDIIK